MRVSEFTLCLRFELRGWSEANNCDAGVKLRNRLDRRDGSVNVGSSFAARMLRRSHVAVASHLLAAGHLGLTHLVGWQAREHGHSRPQSYQAQNDDRACLRHLVMLHA